MNLLDALDSMRAGAESYCDTLNGCPVLPDTEETMQCIDCPFSVMNFQKTQEELRILKLMVE